MEHHNSARFIKKLCRLDYSHVSPGTQKSWTDRGRRLCLSNGPTAPSPCPSPRPFRVTGVNTRSEQPMKGGVRSDSKKKNSPPSPVPPAPTWSAEAAQYTPPRTDSHPRSQRHTEAQKGPGLRSNPTLIDAHMLSRSARAGRGWPRHFQRTCLLQRGHVRGCAHAVKRTLLEKSYRCKSYVADSSGPVGKSCTELIRPTAAAPNLQPTMVKIALKNVIRCRRIARLHKSVNTQHSSSTPLSAAVEPKRLQTPTKKNDQPSRLPAHTMKLHRAITRQHQATVPRVGTIGIPSSCSDSR